jgi:hypothetical protein
MVFFSWRRLSLELKVICIFIIFSILLEAVTTYLRLNLLNNLPYFHIFTWVENILLSSYFYMIYQKKIARMTVVSVALLFILFWLVGAISYPESLYMMPRDSRMTECVIMMIFCIYFYFELFLDSRMVNLTRYPHYWLVSGFLLYFAGTFFLNLVGDMAIDMAQLGFYGYDIHSILNIFLNLIFTLTLWIGRKASISAQS